MYQRVRSIRAASVRARLITAYLRADRSEENDRTLQEEGVLNEIDREGEGKNDQPEEKISWIDWGWKGMTVVWQDHDSQLRL